MSDSDQVQRLYNELALIASSHRYDLVADVCTRILTINPSDYIALVSLGFAQYEQARRSEQDEDFMLMRTTAERALALYPDESDLHYLLFHYYLWYGGAQYVQARDCIQRAIQLNPLSSQYYRWLGEIYLINREADKAAKYLHEAVQLSPEIASYRSRYALALIRMHKVADGKAVAERALQDGPDDMRVMDDVGMIYILLGDLDKANRFFRDAIQRDPTYSYFHQHMAWIKREQRDKSQRDAHHKKYTPLYIRQKQTKRFFDEDGPDTIPIAQS